MRIERQRKNPEEIARLRRELDAVANPPARRRRVCAPDCTAECPTCGGTACGCACHMDCPYIPEQLSCDPAYPIEGGIAPLAFELARLDVFEPFWSCEGHTDRRGDPWKLPRVWFYCDSVIHVRLLAHVMRDLEIKKVIRFPWQVRLTFADDHNPGTAFSLEPMMVPGIHPTLSGMQADAKAIARHLNPMMTEWAGLLLPTT